MKTYRALAMVFDPADLHKVSATGGAMCQQCSELLTTSPERAKQAFLNGGFE
jgi:hypothetical protein